MPIVSAVVYDPLKDEMFTAEKGAGAWMNDRRLRVSDRSEMIEMVFATGIPFASSPNLPQWLQQAAKLSPMCAGLRRWGSAALDLAYVAAGRYDGFWERRLHAWDIAAGIVIAREAGAIVEPLTPGGDIIADGEIICANEPIFETFAKVIRKA